MDFNHRDDNQDQYLCPLCIQKGKPRQYKEVKNLHKHVRKAHVNSEIDGNSTQWLHCDYCPKFFNTKRALGIHIVKFHQDENRKYDPKTQKLIKTEDIQVDPEDIEKKIPCDYCPKYFKTRENHLKVHLQKKHPDKPNPYDDFAQHEGNFSCTKCSETFNNLQTLTYHFNDHNKIENLWQCPLCPKNSKLLKNLWKHERISHLNIRPKPIKHEEGVEVFHCAVCDFSSTKKALLVRYGSTQLKKFS